MTVITNITIITKCTTYTTISVTAKGSPSRGAPAQRVRDCLFYVIYNPSVTATPCHHPRVCCAAPTKGRLFIKMLCYHPRVCYAAPAQERHTLKRPPCAKGAPALAGGGLFLITFPIAKKSKK